MSSSRIVSCAAASFRVSLCEKHTKETWRSSGCSSFRRTGLIDCREAGSLSTVKCMVYRIHRGVMSKPESFGAVACSASDVSAS